MTVIMPMGHLVLAKSWFDGHLHCCSSRKEGDWNHSNSWGATLMSDSSMRGDLYEDENSDPFYFMKVFWCI